MSQVDLPLPGARALAASVLAAPDPPSTTLLGVADMCRRAGALAEAGALLARLPEGVDDGGRRGALEGQPQAAGLTGPSPFLRRTDFLAPDDAAEVLRLANAALADLVPSSIHNSQYDDVKLSTRRSYVATDVDALRRVLMPHVKALVRQEDVPRRMGLATDLPGRYELQFTAHGDGCFFKPHADARPDSNSGRAISFVYYFFNRPKRFEGGDLLLFDGDADSGAPLPTSFTRILPEANSLVVFPSPRVHEVELVRSASPDLAAGRFTLNGWFHHPAPPG